jgi:RNA polymerase sigma-70 factor (ECF subfamily)
VTQSPLLGSRYEATQRRYSTLSSTGAAYQVGIQFSPALSAQDPDHLLVLRCRTGDKEAFNVLVLRHKDRLHMLARRLLKDRGEAEDLVQDTFLRAYLRIEEFGGESKFSTWLHRICYNLCLNRLERKRKEAGSESDMETVPDLTTGSVEYLLCKEQQRLMQWALSHVKPEFREVLLLHNTDHLSYDEIAELLELPVGTVRSRLHRGREELKKLLQPYFSSTATF